MSSTEQSTSSHAHDDAERASAAVLTIALLTMGLEIAGGWWTGSMALTADGWHMGTHAAAMAVAVFAYRFVRRERGSGRYSFGAGKAIDLGGFANAVLLAAVGVMVGFESCGRLFRPERIEFGPALTVAAIGFAVNLLSAWLLRGAHGPEHGHGHDHAPYHHHDHNREAAFTHVLADAVTSAMAVGALFCGRRFGLVWLDPLVGVIGAGVILSWAVGLARRTSAVLLDAAPDEAMLESIRTIVAREGDELVELRVWPIAAGRFAAAVRVSGAGRIDGSELEAVPGIEFVSIHRNSRRASVGIVATPGRSVHRHSHDHPY